MGSDPINSLRSVIYHGVLEMHLFPTSVCGCEAVDKAEGFANAGVFNEPIKVFR